MTASPLPPTVSFAQIANAALVSGYFTSLDPNAPAWSSNAGTLGTFNRNVAVAVAVNAAPASGRSIATYTVVGPAQAMLPAGMYLSTNAAAQAATITGTIDLYPLQFAEPEVPFSPSPTWNTAGGAFASGFLNTAYSQTFSATPLLGTSIARFILLNGNLPFGLSITTNSAANTGTLSGTIDPTSALADGNAVSLPPPVWNTNSGVLATAFNAFSNRTISTSVSATPTFGTTITSYAITGQSTALPEGVYLTPTTGAINGTVDPVTAFQDALFLIPGPTWNTPAGSLGSANNGTAQTLNLSFTPVASTTATLSVVSGGIPAGTSLTTTNATTGTATISGTLDANTTAASTTLNVARTFNFTLRATGSDGGYSDRAFAFTANVT